ncbi:hypothetical protein TSTA_100860 [Talaromyces stipitatus ATCC 10500]|uniref:Uncharacterized protein n=1 Tax=Talaromyces stipitatus (strain ATCC 10500 / CBS 375.48 / QM 6759 / NRRL 1006) TaxID=441959 RepID=B8MMT9_TALSN|nr:uncharacterized protein TSTA_100860 [Talaromyces stipitatus ATCC 10500]EED13845.1 hypothetical protein TSTA_100860 [Talaromyces stipitatus ATCC 10500]
MNQRESPDNPDAPLYVGSAEQWEFSKGLVDIRGDVVVPCDTRFLIELVTKLDRGYHSILKHLVSCSNRTCVIDSDEFCQTVNDVAFFFVEIAREVRRLQRYPRLCRDESLLQTCQSAILSKLSANHDKWARVIGESSSKACWARLQKSEYLIELWLNHPTYQYDLKPWNQFLNDEAPGTGINVKTKFLKDVYGNSPYEPSESVLQGNFHIVPPGGWALWRTWVDHFLEIEKKIYRTVVPPSMRSDGIETPNPKFNRELNKLEPMLYSYQTTTFNFRPNLWQPRGSRERVFPPDMLPALEKFLGISASDAN